MTDRVVFQASAASPLRVSVAGVSAASAQFNNLIFDGNQPPMRLAINGWVAVTVITDANWTAGQTIAEQSAVPAPTVPAGTTPIFMIMFRQPYAVVVSGSTPTAFAGSYRTPARYPTVGGGSFDTVGGKGAGGAICGGQIIGVTFTPATHDPGSGGGPSFNRFTSSNVSYAVFRNYA